MIGHFLKGWLHWQIFRIKYRINYKKAIIVLADENHELDRQVLIHLPDFVKRKHAKSVIVLCKKECKAEWSSVLEDTAAYSVEMITEEDIAYYILFTVLLNSLII